MAAHAFTDPVSRQPCTLHVQAGWMGVEHPSCDHLADVALSIDAFFCRVCTHNGRISGSWASDLYIAAQDALAPDLGVQPSEHREQER
jgi:hypothetical protein